VEHIVLLLRFYNFYNFFIIFIIYFLFIIFLPRCMECRRGLAMRILSVCLPVRPSVCQMHALWQNGRKLCLDFYIIRKTIHLSFLRREWVVGATPSTRNFGSTSPCWSEIADFEPIISHSTSAVKPSEKSSVNTNRKSTTRFSMSLRWSSYIAPNSPRGALKNANRLFSL